jgi:hypothetical protein
VPKSRKRPAKRRRPPTPPTLRTPAAAVDQGEPEPPDVSNEIRKALADTVAQGRLLLTQDPTLGALTHRRRANRDGNDSESGQWWPVALIEPLNYRAVQLDGVQYLLTMAIASKLGLTKAQPGNTPPTAVKWAFRDDSRCELLDPTGTVLAGFHHVPDPRWRTVAQTRGKVFVLYGGQLGVRKPDGISIVEYDDRARDTELHASVAAGAVLAGAVTYAHR